ncbi:MAG TPA: PLDc N-terminal domain-containing protein, partial [Virgibacillus sp.]|nr:PLDc N-terminal domain-containing protein [Virgibacillus sp.]
MTIVTYVMDIIFIVNILMAVAVIFFERQNPNATLAWVMVLLFLPLVGFILYLIFNQNFTRKKMFEWDGQEKEGIQEAIHNQIQEINTGSYPFKDETSAAYKANIYMHLINDGALFTEDNDITIYTDGRKKFDALLADIRQATNHIHIQYYIIHDDGLGTELVAALTEKAREGLDV